MDKKQDMDEKQNNTTKYGEFISTYFAWISLPIQKEKAEKMANMTITKEEDK